MDANRKDVSKAPGKGESEADAKPEAAAATAAKGGGMKAWLPLLANLLLMPALAYATTMFVLLPKMKASLHSGTATAQEHGGGHDKAGGGEHGKDGALKVKTTIPLSGKVLVNVAGTMGTRYLLANINLVSNNPELKGLVEKHDAQLRDAACSALAAKTIADLEKPGARNLIRAELLSAFNSVLGKDMINDIYLTEFAIQ